MIIGDMSRWNQEKGAFSSTTVRAVNYLQQTDFSQLENGEYQIEGDQMYVVVKDVDTRAKTDGYGERHKHYIDIHYVLTGTEWIGFARDYDNHAIHVDELDTKDYALYEKVEDEVFLVLKAGTYAIFYPSDVHRPCCSDTSGKIRKAIIKVHLDLLL